MSAALNRRRHDRLGLSDFTEFDQHGSSWFIFHPLTPNIKEQILLSCPHTFFFIKVLGRSY